MAAISPVRMEKQQILRQLAIGLITKDFYLARRRAGGPNVPSALQDP
jgi:hypothetical protein